MPADLRAETYDAALAYLYGRIDYERRGAQRGRWPLKLDRMRRLLARLGNPHDSLPIVHLAGTKGKGSTATMIAAVLTAAGYRTGLYTSPHLEQLEQRIQVDGRCCSSEELVSLVGAVRGAVAEMDAEADGDSLALPTFFEITTAMALVQFRRLCVDAAVLEVGLGGRLDSTNVCQPRVSVITSISLDHTEQLGKSLGSIAREKAGIIKPGVPVITGVTGSEPLAAIEEVAGNCGVALRRLGHEFDFTYHGFTCGGFTHDGAARLDHSPADFPTSGRMSFRSHGGDGATGVQLGDLRLGMWGRHQAANAAVAVETLLELRRQGWQLPDAAIREGLQAARCPARIELVSHRPAVILDVAHNVASVAALVDTLDEHFPREPSVLIFAASEDKDVAGMLRKLVPRFDRILLTRFPNNVRAADPTALLHEAQRIEYEAGSSGGSRTSAPPAASRITAHDDPGQALETALAFATAEHVVCITGSFFLAAELRPLLRSAVAAAKQANARHSDAPGISDGNPPAAAASAACRAATPAGAVERASLVRPT